MLKESRTNEEFQYQRLSLDEQKQRGILGRLVGVCADLIHPTRNGRKYSEQLWENVFNDPIMKEKIANRCCFGELGHPADRTETDMQKIAICLAEQPVKGGDGKLRAVFDILDTPNGRILKSLCDYGCNIGISSRGEGDLVTDYDGQESVDPDTYSCECFDAVLIPAVKEARMEYVTESLEKKRYNKTLRESLQESYDKASEEDKYVMAETLENLGMPLDEASNFQRNCILVEPHPVSTGTIQPGWIGTPFNPSDKFAKEDAFELAVEYMTNNPGEKAYVNEYQIETEHDFDFKKAALTNKLAGLPILTSNRILIPITDVGDIIPDINANGDDVHHREVFIGLGVDDLYFKNGGLANIMYALNKGIPVMQYAGMQAKVVRAPRILGAKPSLGFGHEPDYTLPTQNDTNASDDEPKERVFVGGDEAEEEEDDTPMEVKSDRVIKGRDEEEEEEEIIDEPEETIISEPQPVTLKTPVKQDAAPVKSAPARTVSHNDDEEEEEEEGDYVAPTPKSVAKSEPEPAPTTRVFSNHDEDEEDIEDESLNIKKSKNLAVDNDKAIVEALQRTLKQNQSLEQKIVELQEKLSVCYAKEAKLEESTEKYKATVQRLAESAKQVNALQAKSSKLEEQLREEKEKQTTLKEQLSEAKAKVRSVADKNVALKENLSSNNSETAQLRESVSVLNEQLNQAIEQNESIKASLKETYNKKLRAFKANAEATQAELNESIAQLQKDCELQKNEYSAKLEKSKQLVEKYKRATATAVDKYIESQAIRLGSSANEIKNRLPESYSFNDIDKACEDLQSYNLNMSKLPFSTISRKPMTESIKIMGNSSKNESILPANGFDDEIDADLMYLAGK